MTPTPATAAGRALLDSYAGEPWLSRQILAIERAARAAAIAQVRAELADSGGGRGLDHRQIVGWHAAHRRFRALLDAAAGEGGR